MIKTFQEFINETYLDKPASPDYLNFDFKKMKKNGYIEVKVINPVDGVEKDEKVMVDASEYGTLDDDSIVTCYTKNGDEIAITKSDLEIEK